MTDTSAEASDVRASYDEAMAKHAQQTAALAIREQKYDLQIDPFEEDRPKGKVHVWMTEVQLERAAQRMLKCAKITNGRNQTGFSDLGTDAALVAEAYLRDSVRHREDHELLHSAAELIKASPPRTVDMTKLKMHPSIQLQSGRYFDFTNPDSTPLEIIDIAAGLSRICRYTGQLRIGEDDIYSVAQHSVLASENCDEDCDPYEALLHDRFESVGNDMASPFKQLLPDYKHYEAKCETSTASYYGLPEEMSPACKRIDLRLLATEKRDLMPGDMADDKWALIQDVEPLPFRITPWRPGEARHRFLQRYYYLTEGKLPAPDDPYARPHPFAPQAWRDLLTDAWGYDCRFPRPYDFKG